MSSDTELAVRRNPAMTIGLVTCLNPMFLPSNWKQQIELLTYQDANAKRNKELETLRIEADERRKDREQVEKQQRIDIQAMALRREEVNQLEKKQQHDLKIQKLGHEQRLGILRSEQAHQLKMHQAMNAKILSQETLIKPGWNSQMPLNWNQAICIMLNHYFNPSTRAEDMIDLGSIAMVVKFAVCRNTLNWQLPPNVLRELWNRTQQVSNSGFVQPLLHAKATYKKARVANRKNSRFMDATGVIRKNPKEDAVLTHILFDEKHIGSLRLRR